MYRTIQEWNKDGYWVKKGSKATWIDGKPKFSDLQVKRSSPKYNKEPWSNLDFNEESHWEMDQDFAHEHHFGWGDD